MKKLDLDESIKKIRNKLLNKLENKKIKKIGNYVRYFFGVIFIIGFFISFGIGFKFYYIFCLLTGITLLPCLYSYLNKIFKIKNKKILIIIQIVIPLIFCCLFALFMPSEVKITESIGECSYNEKFKIKNGSVYYYCLDKVEIKQDDDTYLELEKIYVQNNNILRDLIGDLVRQNTYSDHSILYKNSFYSIIKCNNGDYVIGNSDLKLEIGMCGFNGEENSDKENDKNNTDTKDENSKNEKDYSNLKNIKDKKLKENFIIACNESNIKAENIKNIKKVDDWNNGPRYTFDYKSMAFVLYAYDNGTVSSITIVNKNLDKIYLDGYEALDVENFMLSSSDITDMQIKAENEVKSILNYPNSADFKWFTSGSYSRVYNIYVISGNVEAKNAFGMESEETFYIEYKMSNGVLSTVYMKFGDKIYKGITSQIPKIERKEKPISNTDSNTNEIIIKDGVKGEYGKEDIFDGEKYIRYYLPAGKYKVEALVKNATFFIESKEIYKNSSGFDESSVIERIQLSKVGDNKEINIPDNGCISMVLHSQIKLIKLS